MKEDRIPFEKLLGMTDWEWSRLSKERFGSTPEEMEDRAFRELMDLTDDTDDC